MKEMKDQIRKPLLSVGDLPNLPGWAELPNETRKTVEQETVALDTAFDGMLRSRIAIGEHYTRLYSILHPLRLFQPYCEMMRLNRSTALNYIGAYSNAGKVLPPAVLRVAAVQGYNLLGHKEDAPLGKYTAAVKKLPPPKTDNVAKISSWLEEVEDLRRTQKRKAKEVDPDTDALLKTSYRQVVNLLDKVPSRRRRGFLEKLFGMVLTKVGISQAQQFEPEAIPDDFKAVVGRPPAPRLVA